MSGRSLPEARAGRAGFTLIELMMVVAILGVLAAISLPSLSAYIYKSKVTEATGFLNEIKARQESYRADFGQYANVSASQTTFYPASTPSSNQMTWTDPLPVGWTQLGAAPPGRRSLFRYSTVAGPPGAGTLPSAAGFSDARGYTGADFWFISTAEGDLDGDSTTVRFESYSHSKSIYCNLAKGWE